MNDREMLTDWIGDFLWHWRLSGLSEDDAVDVIMCVLSDYPTLFARETAHHAPDAEALVGILSNRSLQEKLGVCDVRSALDRLSGT